MKEIWKDVTNYEKIYQISSLGRIKGLERISLAHRRLPEKILKPQPDKDGYLRILLYSASGAKRHALHKLVAYAFIPNPDNLPFVLHGDDIPSHNWVSNLRWGTHQDNMDDMVSRKRHWKHKR